MVSALIQFRVEVSLTPQVVPWFAYVHSIGGSLQRLQREWCSRVYPVSHFYSLMILPRKKG